MKIILAMCLLVCTFQITQSSSYAQNFLSSWPADKGTGEKAPDFKLKDIHGKEVSLSSFRGKPVLLNFWATWCHYCKKERPYLKALYETYKNSDLVIIAVAVKSPENDINRFMEQNPAPYIVVPDPEGWADVPYNITSLPTTFLVDRNGAVRRKFLGMQEWSEKNMKDILDALIDQKAAVKQ